MKKKLTFISDAAHGWLSVSIKDVIALGIKDKISKFSYMTPNRVYLEEDEDAGIFMDAAKAAGWEIEFKETYSETWSGRNNYSPYNVYFVDHRFVEGCRFSVKGVNGTYKEKRAGFRNGILEMDGGGYYTPFKANPMRHVYPPIKEGEVS